ncbi:MAG: hypothetical protein OYG31_02310 [Candidatus Kaiserbacteria bacterium]|nr:hypothetical protein [Candidatus Kaiserbacteria bacterium]
MGTGERKERGRPFFLVSVLFIIASVVLVAAPRGVRIVDDFSVYEYQPEQYTSITNEVVATSAVIYDIDANRILAGKNPMTPTSIASITKLTAALIAVRKINDFDTTTVTEEDLSVLQITPIKPGDRWRTLDLIRYALMTSSNGGISAVARTVEEKVGTPLVDLMNTFAREHGLVQTHFVNVTGLDAHGTLAGSESSARDLAAIASILIRNEPELANATARSERLFYTLDGREYRAENTNELLGNLPHPVLLSKTGFTNIAGGTLLMVLEIQGRRIAFVVLNSTKEERFIDMQTLFQLYRSMLLSPSVR